MACWFGTVGSPTIMSHLLTTKMHGFYCRAGEPRDPLSRVEEQERDVGAADRPLGAMDRVEVEAVPDLRLPADARGVDRQERQPVELELDVDRVPRGSRYLGDDHPLRAGQR